MATVVGAGQIPCCICGTLIYPNDANQCAACLAQGFDLQAHLQKGPGGVDHCTVHQCRQCRRFEKKPGYYEYAEPESPELLAICLKQIPAINSSAATSPKLHLVDASWIWTEPHSMRFRLLLTVRTELSRVLLEQRCRVELHCAFQLCPACNREASKRTWHAVVQVRQKGRDGDHRPGVTRIEQALGRNKDLRQHVLRLDSGKNGLDFYFLHLSQAQSFVHTLQRLAPMRVHTTSRQVSTNVQNHTAHTRHTLTCDLLPIWRHDLIWIPPRRSSSSSGQNHYLGGRLWLVEAVGEASVTWVDAAAVAPHSTVRRIQVSATAYAQQCGDVVRIVLTPQRWHTYTVLDVDDDDGARNHSVEQQQPSEKGENITNSKKELPTTTVDVHIVSESGTQHTVTSHVGHGLAAGDTVYGYDLAGSTLEWKESDFVRHYVVPDIVLVKKMTDRDAEKKQQQEEATSSNNARSGKKLSKKQERRRRKENRKMKELEERAERMGLLGEEGEDADLDAELAQLELQDHPPL